MRDRARRLGFGLSTVLGLKPRGFFIPYRYAASVTPAAYPALRPLFAAAEPGFAAVMAEIAGFSDALRSIAAGNGPARFDQDWFPRLDAAAAYTLVRSRRPRRIVEIGSGHSTRFLARAVADGGLATQITCIDPAPRASLDRLGVRHLALLLRDADPALFAELRANDILFVDSSHIAMPGTDVDRLVLDVLPRLAPGVLIHIHDVFLPDGYPAAWRWRGYNEQALVGALLLGGGFEITFASRYVVAHAPYLARDLLDAVPLAPGALETSVWLTKR